VKLLTNGVIFHQIYEIKNKIKILAEVYNFDPLFKFNLNNYFDRRSNTVIYSPQFINFIILFV